MTEAKFLKAVEIVQNLPKEGPKQSTNEEKLKYYALYKQATIGDVNTTRPGMLDFTGKAKWDAWKEVEGKPQEEAKAEYVELLAAALTKDGEKELLAQLEAA